MAELYKAYESAHVVLASTGRTFSIVAGQAYASDQPEIAEIAERFPEYFRLSVAPSKAGRKAKA